MRRPPDSRNDRVAIVARRGLELAPTVAAITVGLVALRAAWPAPANAADLFPVDDWLGEGLKKAGDVALGPLKLGAKEIAELLATIVGALADLLVPKSLVNAGLGGIKWLVQLPPVGADATPDPGVPDVRMPHLAQLRDTMTWIGVTVLPLGLVMSAGRAYLAPTADGDSPAEVLGRVVTAGIGLLIYDWAWGVVTELSQLLTGGLLGLPWVKDGVERMLETLVIGGATGSAVAAEFVVPLMILVAGTVLLGLLLVRVGLEVATALLYVLGGLVLGLSVTGFGRRLLSAWLIAAAAIVMLPLLWSAVFATGAALMLDAGDTGGKGGLASFVAQLYNVAAALAVFWIAIKLALGVFKHASGAITGIATTPAAAGAGGGGGRGGAARLQALAQNATPAGLARFSRNLRGGLQAAARFPVHHPIRTAQAGSYPLRRPVQATREAASGLADAMTATGGRAQEVGQRAAEWHERERHGGRFSARAADARANAHAARTSGAGSANGSKANAEGRDAQPTRTAGADPGTRSVQRAAPAGSSRPGAAALAGAATAPPPPSRPRAPDGGTSAPQAPRLGAAPPPATPEGGVQRSAAPPRVEGRASATPRPVWLRRPRPSREDRDGRDKR
jgi:hypothetical protein